MLSRLCTVCLHLLFNRLNLVSGGVELAFEIQKGIGNVSFDGFYLTFPSNSADHLLCSLEHENHVKFILVLYAVHAEEVLVPLVINDHDNLALALGKNGILQIIFVERLYSGDQDVVQYNCQKFNVN